ncbi:MAG: KEOPS complex subunit Cgi121 [Methanoregula sp.]|jgi:KEOPS complex subunit Cgi121
MLPLPAASDIRAARCSIRDPAAFLKDLRAIATAYHTHIICFNADMIAGRIHAATAVTSAVRAREEGVTISNTLEMESLLFAAGCRQCNTAASFGIHAGENLVYICCIPVQPEVWKELEPLFLFVQENWDIIDSKKRDLLKETYAISQEEIAAAGGDERIINLVLERVALLQVMR